MKLSSKDYKNFTQALKKINDTAGSAMEQYIANYGLDDVDSLVRYGYGVSSVYGNASASLAAIMYDEIVAMENKVFPAAELAENPEFGEVAQAIQGTLKQSVNIKEVSGAVSRLVKRTGQDTLIKNGMRDGAEFAWVPIGDTCPLCKTIASRGWQPISKKALKKGHAEHIHANCDCSYMIRHDSNFNVAGYNPDKYLEEYENAEGKTASEKINSMRRMQYAKRKDVINAQKRAAYAARNNKNEIKPVANSAGSIYNGLGRNVRFKTGDMAPDEYARAVELWNKFDELPNIKNREHIIEEFDNWLTPEEKSRCTVSREIDNYRYYAIRKGHNEYKIYSMEPVSEGIDWLDEVLSEVIGKDWRKYDI